MYESLEAIEQEDLEDFEDFEDLEDLEDFEDYEAYEDMEDYEDMEGDPFIGKWVKRGLSAARGALKGPLGGALKGLARTAAQAAGGAIGGPAGAKLASMVANKVIRESDFESDMEEEADLEGTFQAMGGNQEILDEMEYLADLASRTNNEAEADQFLGAIASLAGPLVSSLMKESEDLEDYEDYEDYEDFEDESDQFLPFLAPLAANLLPKAIPFISKGIGALGKALFRRGGNKVVKALPRIAMKTATSIARQQQAGRPVSRKQVATTMARQTAKTIASKPQLEAAIVKNTMGLRRHARHTAQVATRAVQPGIVRPGVGVPAVVRGANGTGPAMARGRTRRVVRPRYCVY